MTPAEAEQALINDPVFVRLQIDEEIGEVRINEIGPTDKGRLLFVASTIRSGWHRVITAFDADRKTRALYRGHFEGKET